MQTLSSTEPHETSPARILSKKVAMLSACLEEIASQEQEHQDWYYNLKTDDSRRNYRFIMKHISTQLEGILELVAVVRQRNTKSLSDETHKLKENVAVLAKECFKRYLSDHFMETLINPTTEDLTTK